MNFAKTIDLWVADMRAAGRINSDGSDRAYRDVLGWHAQDCEVDDPRRSDHEDVLRTLARWPHPTTKRQRHAILASFYSWMVRRRHRKDNPADQVERAPKRKADPPRLRQDEALAMLSVCETVRENRVIYLAILGGVRNQELRRLRGKHFARPGLIWISPEVGKGGRPRWLPVLDEAVPVVEEIRANVCFDEYVVPAQRRDPQRREWFDLPYEQCSGQAVWRLVRRVAERAGVVGNPHALRRAFADLIEQHSDVRVAQQLLGHASLATTELYLSDPTLDSLQAAVVGASLGPSAATSSTRSKVSSLPSSSDSRTASPSTSTSTGSVSIWPKREVTVAKTVDSMQYRHGDSNPGFGPHSTVAGLARLLEFLWYRPGLRAAARGMADV